MRCLFFVLAFFLKNAVVEAWLDSNAESTIAAFCSSAPEDQKKELVRAISYLISVTQKENSSDLSEPNRLFFDEISQKNDDFVTKINELCSFLASDLLLHLHDDEDLSDYAELSYLLTHSNLGREASFLIPPDDLRRTPFDVYDDVARKIKNLNIQKDDHFPLFGHISAILLRHYLNTGSFIKKSKVEIVVAVIAVLLDELKWALSQKMCTYEWFLCFNKRILIIENPELRCTNFSTVTFDTFAYDFARTLITSGQIVHKQTFFREYLDFYANFTYQQTLSPRGLSELCPHILTLPFPFDLTVEEVFKATLFTQCAFWPLGFSFHDCMDGDFKMSPHIFYEHDINHLACLLNSNAVMFKNHSKVSKAVWGKSDISGIKQFTIKRILLINKIKEIAYSIIQKEEDAFKKKIFTFYAFWFFHEFRMQLPSLLTALLNPVGLGFVFEPEVNLFLSPCYLKLLPSSIQECSDKTSNHRIMKDHLNEFCQLIISLLDESSVASWREVANTLSLRNVSGEAIAQENPSVLTNYVYSGYRGKVSREDDGLVFVDFKMDPCLAASHSLGSMTYANKQALEGLEIDPEKDGEQSFTRFVFNSILPDGREIDRSFPSWIERLDILKRTSVQDQPPLNK